MIRDFQSFNKRKWLFGMLILIAAALIALPSALAGGETGKELPGEAAEQEMRDSNSSRPSQQQDEPEEGLLMEWPAEGKVTFSFGYSTAGKKADFHDGIDIANDPGTEVAAAAAGTVLEAGYSGKNGKYIVIEHDDNWRTEYHHLSELTVDEGRAVEAGEFIGRMGSTGSATGPHLHFSIMKDGEYIDPMTVLKQP